MKCYDIGILQAYIDGELSSERMQKVAGHLDLCKSCQKTFEELIELNEWELELKTKDMLVEPIDVEKAWNKLEGTLKKQDLSMQTFDVEKTWKKLEDKLDNKNIISKIKGAFMSMNKMKKFMTVVTASALIVIGVPVVASGIYNLFTSHVLEDDIVNHGMTREDGTVVDATKDGQFIALDQKITDKNTTVHLTELYVSESRVSVHYRIEDQEGNLVPVEYNTEGLDLKYDGMIDGKQVEAPEYYLDREIGSFSTLQFLACEDALPFELMKDGKALDIGIRELGDKNEGTITFVGFNPIDYPVMLDININQIGKVTGSWTGQIEIKPNNK